MQDVLLRIGKVPPVNQVLLNIYTLCKYITENELNIPKQNINTSIKEYVDIQFPDKGGNGVSDEKSFVESLTEKKDNLHQIVDSNIAQKNTDISDEKNIIRNNDDNSNIIENSTAIIDEKNEKNTINYIPDEKKISFEIIAENKGNLYAIKDSSIIHEGNENNNDDLITDKKSLVKNIAAKKETLHEIEDNKIAQEIIVPEKKDVLDIFHKISINEKSNVIINTKSKEKSIIEKSMY